jgi:protein farnesyltransferase subunit beta
LSTAQHDFAYHDEEKFVEGSVSAAFGWSVVGRADVPCEDGDWVKAIHPVFVVPFERAMESRTYFEEQGGF